LSLVEDAKSRDLLWLSTFIEQNQVDGPIGSIGIGARIYSSKSSYGNVAHVDIAVPITTGNDINAWEFRFQVKDHF
jgi:hypothetical protein